MMGNKLVTFQFDKEEVIDKEKVLKKANDEAKAMMKNSNVKVESDNKGNVVFRINKK